MRCKLLIIGLVVLVLIGSSAAQEVTTSDDMDFIEFLGSFEKDIDIQMMATMPALQEAPLQSPLATSSYGEKDMQKGGNEDE
jgi:hypothetical protein